MLLLLEAMTFFIYIKLCESWNHSFPKLVGKAHPSLYVLVFSLQEDESTASITGYVAVIVLVIPASTEVKYASFSSLYIRNLVIPASIAVKLIVIPASIAVKHALFSSQNTCGRIEEVHPVSIALKHALFSSHNTCQH